jgi:hypothetical protein
VVEVTRKELLQGYIEVPKYDYTQHDMEQHSYEPLSHSLAWYDLFTPKGTPKCPTCSAIAETREETND